MKTKLVIECPNCGRQYLPGEIYLPTHFLGQPTNVVREIDGSILNFDGIKQDLREQYVCDKCSKKFKIDADITYTTTSATSISTFNLEED